MEKSIIREKLPNGQEHVSFSMNPERLKDESFVDYKERRKLIKKFKKTYLKGKKIVVLPEWHDDYGEYLENELYYIIPSLEIPAKATKLIKKLDNFLENTEAGFRTMKDNERQLSLLKFFSGEDSDNFVKLFPHFKKYRFIKKEVKK